MGTTNKTIIDILSKIKVNKRNEQFLNVVISKGRVYLAHEYGYIDLNTDLSKDLHGRVSIKRFLDLLKNNIEINNGMLSAELKVYSPIENEVDDDFKNTVNFFVNEEFLNLYEFTSNDELRPSLTGVYLSDEICATNAHILKTIKTNIFKDFNVILPKIALKLLPTGDYEVSLNSRYIEFKNENCIFIFTLIDMKYPNYRAITPSYNELSVKLDKKELMNAIKKCLIFANKTTKMLILEQNGFEFSVSGSDVDMGLHHKEVLSHSSSNSMGFKIGLSATLLQTIIKNENSNTIEFDFIYPSKPVLINKNSLIMPILI